MDKNMVTQLLDKYSRWLNEVEYAYSRCPHGYLHIVKKGSTISFYHCHENGSDGTYLNKDNKESLKVIEQLANKRYWRGALRILKKNVAVLSYARDKMSDEELGNCYDKLPEPIKGYVSPFEISDDEYAERWIARPFKTNSYKADNTELKTVTGVRVRSKSEVIIANQLTAAGLLYKYEKIIRINGIDYYPDFTVLNKKTRTEYIWEHFGLMGNEEYQAKALKKIQMYTKYCLDNHKKFIATFESNNVQLSVEYITSVIRNNFES